MSRNDLLIAALFSFVVGGWIAFQIFVAPMEAFP